MILESNVSLSLQFREVEVGETVHHILWTEIFSLGSENANVSHLLRWNYA